MQLTASRTVSGEHFRKHDLLQVAALKNIKAGKELSVGYGEKFMF